MPASERMLEKVTQIETLMADYSKKTEARIAELEQGLNEAVVLVEEKEKENEDLQRELAQAKIRIEEMNRGR